MCASVDKPRLPPRVEIVMRTVDRESVRAIVRAERAFLAQAVWMGIDADEAHLGYALYIANILDQLGDNDKAEFEELLVEETVNYDELDEARANLAAAEQRYSESVNQPEPSSSFVIFLLGVSAAIFIGLAFFWANE